MPRGLSLESLEEKWQHLSESTQYDRIYCASTFSISLFFSFFQIMNSKITWIYYAGDNYHCLRTIAVLFMHCSSIFHALKNIKNGFHGTIHTFKNYFATIFLVFSFSKNKLYPNRLLEIIVIHLLLLQKDVEFPTKKKKKSLDLRIKGL